MKETPWRNSCVKIEKKLLLPVHKMLLELDFKMPRPKKQNQLKNFCTRILGQLCEEYHNECCCYITLII
jgi:hypothetical protein